MKRQREGPPHLPPERERRRRRARRDSSPGVSEETVARILEGMRGDVDGYAVMAEVVSDDEVVAAEEVVAVPAIVVNEEPQPVRAILPQDEIPPPPKTALVAPQEGALIVPFYEVTMPEQTMTTDGRFRVGSIVSVIGDRAEDVPRGLSRERLLKLPRYGPYYVVERSGIGGDRYLVRRLSGDAIVDGDRLELYNGKRSPVVPYLKKTGDVIETGSPFLREPDPQMTQFHVLDKKVAIYFPSYKGWVPGVVREWHGYGAVSVQFDGERRRAIRYYYKFFGPGSMNWRFVRNRLPEQ